MEVSCRGCNDWIKLIPYVLFGYREISHKSNGYLPFELLYGQRYEETVRYDQRDLISKHQRQQSVLSHIFLMREMIREMSELVQRNLTKAHASTEESV